MLLRETGTTEKTNKESKNFNKTYQILFPKQCQNKFRFGNLLQNAKSQSLNYNRSATKENKTPIQHRKKGLNKTTEIALKKKISHLRKWRIFTISVFLTPTNMNFPKLEDNIFVWITFRLSKLVI